MRSHCNAKMGLNMLLLMDTQVVDTFVTKHKAWQIAKEVVSTSSLPKIEVPKLTKKKKRKTQRFTQGRQKALKSTNYINDPLGAETC